MIVALRRRCDTRKLVSRRNSGQWVACTLRVLGLMSLRTEVVAGQKKVDDSGSGDDR